MYNQETIDFLINRVGWAKALKSDFPVEISAENLANESGRVFQAFHQLATVENLYENIVQPKATAEQFNEVLADLKKQAVLETLSLVMNSHFLYKDEFDYSDTIQAKTQLFDEVIGYTAAIKCIELFLSSTRKNATERSNAMSLNVLKVELEGARNDNGYYVAKGLTSKRFDAIKKAQRILFPDTVIIQDGSNFW